VPDCSGCYTESGVYGGQTAYERCDGIYWVWRDAFAWVVSLNKGEGWTPNWESPEQPGVEGDYTPQVGAEGTATVALA